MAQVTEIAKAVTARQQELKEREAGTFVPKPGTPWMKLIKPHIAPKAPNPKTGYDIDCCVYRCPECCHGCCLNRKPPEAKSDDSELDANTFTESERKTLLTGIYSRQSPQSRRALTHLYMMHMCLSNTVKPFIKNGKLEFQAESAEELAMVQFAQKCGYIKLAEKEEAERTEEEKRANFSFNTRVAVTSYDERFQPVGKPQEQRFSFLACLGFTSARARVTVIYQEETTKKILIMTKGQDTTVLPLFKAGGNAPRKEDEEKLLFDLNELCNNGLRTLVAGHAEKDAAWWTKWAQKYDTAKDLPESPFSKDHSAGKCDKTRCEKCIQHNLYNDIECDAGLVYLGCLGLEDQLQNLVPECIATCLKAGVKVWMITGDKLETARNIGLACNLIDADMQPQLKSGVDLEGALDAFENARLIEVTGEWANLAKKKEELAKMFDLMDFDQDGVLSLEETDVFLRAVDGGTASDEKRSTLWASMSNGKRVITKAEFVDLMEKSRPTMYEAVKADIDNGIRRYERIKDHEADPISVLVNRDAFLTMFPGKSVEAPKPGDPTPADLAKLADRFFALASVAKSVVFARAQPAMKKKMVTEIMNRVPNVTTLAIGDGANDTEMITEAHIGVGIDGVEGTAATSSADYAIGTFRMLHTLLFVHGFWSYQRIANLVNFIFYKACLVAVTQFLFGFFSGFSGQQFFNDPIYQLYNVMFTALPILSVAVLDKPLPKAMLENNPIAFKEQKHQAFNAFVFGCWILRSFLHSISIFFFPLLTFGYQNVAKSDGTSHDLWFWSTTVFFGAALLPTFQVIFIMQSIQIVHLIFILLSIVAIFFVIFLLELFISLNPGLYGVVSQMYTAPSFWLTLALSVLTPLLIEMAFRFIKRQCRPTFTHILQELLYIAREKEKDTASSSRGRLRLDSSDPSLADASLPLRERPIIGAEEEKKWKSLREGPEEKGVETAKQMLARLRRHSLVLGGGADGAAGAAGAGKESEDKLRRGVVRSLLRFRNGTGSTFESAAQVPRFRG